MKLSGCHCSNPAEAGDQSGDMVRIEADHVKWVVRCPAISEKLEQVLANPDRFLTDPALLVADSPLITLGRIPPFNREGPTLLLRRLNYGRLRHRLRDVFRQTRVERAFWHGLNMEKRGVATPRVLAAGVWRILRWPVRAYLITEWVPGAVTLEEILKKDRQLPRNQVFRLADLLASLHNHGFSHRDLKSSNVLFDETFKPVLIDLDGVRGFKQLSRKHAEEDLLRFSWEFVAYPQFFKWNGLRFLKRYCQQRHMENDRSLLKTQILQGLRQRLALGITYWKK